MEPHVHDGADGSTKKPSQPPYNTRTLSGYGSATSSLRAMYSIPGSGAMTPRTPGVPTGEDGEYAPLLGQLGRGAGEVEEGSVRSPKGE